MLLSTPGLITYWKLVFSKVSSSGLQGGLDPKSRALHAFRKSQQVFTKLDRTYRRILDTKALRFSTKNVQPGACLATGPENTIYHRKTSENVVDKLNNMWNTLERHQSRSGT